jgi:cobalt-zinc-cadmium efflux system protein
MGHDHGHHHHDHRVGGKTLFLALGLTLFFALVETVGGFWSGSLALLGDAGHMFSDSFSLGLAAFASLLAMKPATTRFSYGYGRVEVVVALINVLLMFGVVAWIATEAWQRFISPAEVRGTAVMLIAFIGLVVNLLVAWVLHRGEQTLNTRAAMLHVLGDLLGSVAALASGLVIALTGWLPIDPILSLLISALILVSSIRLLRETLNLILEGVPSNIDLEEVGRAMAGSAAGVRSVHDLHIWAVSSNHVMLSAHVIIDDLSQWPSIHKGMERLLHDRYEITHVTLQPVAVPESVALDSILGR